MVTAPAASEDAGLVLSAEPGGDLWNAVSSVYDRHDHRRPLNHVNVVEWIEAVLPVVAARVEAARAEAVHQAADEIQALHPGEVKNSVVWLHENAARIARTPPPAGTSQPLRATNDDRENA